MEKKYFALKLIPPRPTFAQDMNEEERAIMQQHIVYWSHLMDSGIALIYGPVSDPGGAYGLGIIEVDDETQVEAITKNDPAATINHYEAWPMRAILPKKVV
jgi:uncharacterized protein